MSIQQLNRLPYKIKTETENFINKIKISPKQFCHIVLHPLKTNPRIPHLISSIVLGVLSLGLVHAGCAIANTVMRKKGHWKTLQPQNNQPQATERAHHQEQSAKEPSLESSLKKITESLSNRLPWLTKSLPKRAETATTVTTNTPKNASSNATSATNSTHVPSAAPSPSFIAISSESSMTANPKPALVAPPLSPLIPPSAASQGHFDRWLTLWDEGNGLRALQSLEEAAKQGHIQAQLKWAELQFRGFGASKRDKNEVLAEIAGIVDKGTPELKREMADAILNGSNPDTIHSKAKEWMASAAQHGNVLAHFQMTRLELMESIKAGNVAKARELFSKLEAAAESGDKYSCEFVGGAYLSGIAGPRGNPIVIIEKNPPKGMHYVEAAIKQGMPNALITKIFITIDAQYGPEAKQQQLADLKLEGDILQLLESAELKTNGSTLYALGIFFKAGISSYINPDMEKAKKYLEMAHQLHFVKATQALANIYSNEKDPASKEKGLMYLYILEGGGAEKASIQIPHILKRLIDGLKNGSKEDKKKALEYFDELMQRNEFFEDKAFEQMAGIAAEAAVGYWSSKEQSQDLPKAEKYLEQAIKICSQQGMSTRVLLPSFSAAIQESGQQVIDWFNSLQPQLRDPLKPITTHIHATLATNYWKGINGYPLNIEEAKTHILKIKNDPRGELLLGVMLVLGVIEPMEGLDGYALIQNALQEDDKTPSLTLEDVLIAKTLLESSERASIWIAHFADAHPDINAYSKFLICKDAPSHQAFDGLKTLADSGNGIACHLLSEIYFGGMYDQTVEIVPRDLELANQYLDRAVQQNIPAALVLKAQKLLDAPGEHDSEPMDLLQKAAKAGYSEAYFVMAQQKQGREADDLYAEAARLGSLDAITMLAETYFNDGDVTNLEQALKYLTMLENSDELRNKLPGFPDERLSDLRIECGSNYWLGLDGVTRSLPKAKKYLSAVRDKQRVAYELCVIALFHTSQEDPSSIKDRLKSIKDIVGHIENDQLADLAAILLPLNLPAIYRTAIELILRSNHAIPVRDELAAFECTRHLQTGAKAAFLTAFNGLKELADGDDSINEFDLDLSPHPRASLHLSQFYFNGVALNGKIVIPKNSKLGWEYLSKAAAEGAGGMQQKVSIFAAERMITGDAPPAASAFAKLDPIETLKQAVEDRDPQATYLLATLHENGKSEFGIGCNPSYAFELYAAASSWGHLEATRRAARLRCNTAEGDAYYSILANFGDPEGCQWKKVPMASDPFEDLVEKAINGNAKAQGQLGKMYLKGSHGVPEWPSVGRRFLEMAADAGDPEAFVEQIKPALFRGNASKILDTIKQHASSENPEIMTSIAMMIIKFNSYGCFSPELMENVNWFQYAKGLLEKAVEAGYQQAQAELANLNYGWAYGQLDRHHHPDKYDSLSDPLDGEGLAFFQKLLADSRQTLNDLASQNQPHACLIRARLLNLNQMEADSPEEGALHWVEKALASQMVTPEALVLKAEIILGLNKSENAEVVKLLLEQAIYLGSEEAAFKLFRLIESSDEEEADQLLYLAEDWGSVQAYWEHAKETSDVFNWHLSALVNLGHREATLRYIQLKK